MADDKPTAGYIRFSTLVKQAIATENHDLAKHLQGMLKPRKGQPRYDVLLKALEGMPEPQSEPDKSDEPLPVRGGRITLKDAKIIIGHHERYKTKHRKIVKSEFGDTNKRRKLKRLQIECMKAIKATSPTHLSVGEKIEEAQDLLGIQTHGSYNPDGSLVKSPPFQGGRMLRGGLPGSRR